MLDGKVIGITGGSGYLGSHLARELVRTNAVVILDTRPPAADPAGPRVSYRQCDVRQPDDCLHALKGVDVLFHRAGLAGNLPSMRRPLDYYAVNLRGTLNVLRAARLQGVQRFIFDSTTMVYGEQVVSPVTEDQVPRPNSVYGATKLAAEQAVRMYDRVHGLSTLIFRYCRVRDSLTADIITRLTKKCLGGEPVELFDDGKPVIDFVDVNDVVAANILGAASAVRNDVLNISSGEGRSLKGLLDAVVQLSGSRPSDVRFTALAPYPVVAENQFGPGTFYASAERARSLLGWRPQVGLDQSIAGTVRALTA